MSATKAPKKRGRPKVAKEHAKACIVPVRFSSGDLAMIAASAKAEGKTVSAWIRAVVRDRSSDE